MELVRSKSTTLSIRRYHGWQRSAPAPLPSILEERWRRSSRPSGSSPPRLLSSCSSSPRCLIHPAPRWVTIPPGPIATSRTAAALIASSQSRLPVQELIAELGVEALAVPVLPSTFRFNVERPDSSIRQPLAQTSGHELRAV